MISANGSHYSIRKHRLLNEPRHARPALALPRRQRRILREAFQQVYSGRLEVLHDVVHGRRM